jgi:hypothetical protein
MSDFCHCKAKILPGRQEHDLHPHYDRNCTPIQICSSRSGVGELWDITFRTILG